MKVASNKGQRSIYDAYFRCPVTSPPKNVLNCTPHFVRRNCSQAIGLVENTIIKTWAAPELRTDHDAVTWAARAEPLGPLWTEDGHNRHVQQVRKMHGTAVVANKKPAEREHGQKSAKIQAHCVATL